MNKSIKRVVGCLIVFSALWPLSPIDAASQSFLSPFIHSPIQGDEEIHDIAIVTPTAQSGTGKNSTFFLDPLNPVIADLYFDEGHSLIEGGMKDFILDTVSVLEREKLWKLSIEGHCDARGTYAYNLALANDLLTNLTNYMKMMGVQSDRIQLINFGQDPFICQDGSERCQEDNLRAHRVFSILAVGQTRRGCLARMRLVGRKDLTKVLDYSPRVSSRQRIQVAAPNSSSF